MTQQDLDSKIQWLIACFVHPRTGPIINELQNKTLAFLKSMELGSLEDKFSLELTKQEWRFLMDQKHIGTCFLIQKLEELRPK